MILLDKDKNIMFNIWKDEDKQEAIKKTIIESIADNSVDITPAIISNIFDGIDSILEEYNSK